MTKTPLLLVAPMMLAAMSARGAVLDRVCTIPSHQPNAFAVRLDPARRMVVQNGLPLADGTLSAELPGLAYFVSEAGGIVAWGARNARTGTTYYRYELDTAAGTLSYDAERFHAEGPACHRPSYSSSRGPHRGEEECSSKRFASTIRTRIAMLDPQQGQEESRRPRNP